MMRWRWILSVWIAVTAVAPAASRPASALYVRAEVQMVQLPQARALALLPQLAVSETAAVAWAEIQADCAAGRAQRLAVLLAHARAGSEETAFQRDLVPLPESPNTDEPLIWPPGNASSADRSPAPYAPREYGAGDFGYWMSLRVEPSFDGNNLALSIETQHRVFNGWERIESGERADGQILYYPEANSIERSAKSVVVTQSNVPLLLGTWKIAEHPDTIELHVLTLAARQVGPPLIPKPGTPPLDPRLVRLETQRFRLPLMDALALRPRLLAPHTVAEAHAELLRQAAGGSAELVDWLSAPGQQGSVKSAHPSTLPEAVNMSIGYHGGPLPVPPSEPFKYAWWNKRPMDPPQEFDFRETGGTLDFELLDGGPPGLVKMRIHALMTEPEGYWRYEHGPNKEGHRSHILAPIFSAARTGTIVSLPPGRPLLYAFRKIPDSDRAEITILRATIVHAGKPIPPQ
jgi:hypothetical protein